MNTFTDAALKIYLAGKDRYVIASMISKVGDHGHDGSGLFCPRIEGNKNADYCVENYCFSAHPIDESETFIIVEDQSFDMKANRNLLNLFDRVPEKDMDDIWGRAKHIARRGKYGGALLLGKKAVNKIIKF